jgi:Cu(I)/Ag(I) efflux system membrane protein CusA/SilA
MGHSAEEVAGEVTEKLTRELEGVPGSKAIRGSSMTGMGFVDVVFDSDAALEGGRREIVRRVGALGPRLHPTVRVQVGPIASSTSWVFQYAAAGGARLTRMAQSSWIVDPNDPRARRRMCGTA